MDVGAAVTAPGEVHWVKQRIPAICHRSHQLLCLLVGEPVAGLVPLLSTRSPVQVIQAVPALLVSADWGLLDDSSDGADSQAVQGRKYRRSHSLVTGASKASDFVLPEMRKWCGPYPRNQARSLS